jgi:SPX domain protein involved in polyphosphate accumulation
MKFGKQLQASLVPGWAPHYVDYKAMKQLLKGAPHTGRQAGRETDEPTARLHAFVTLLISQLERVNGFFGLMESRVCAQWGEAQVEMEAVAAMANDPGVCVCVCVCVCVFARARPLFCFLQL